MNPTNVTIAPSARGQAFTLHGRFALLLACVLAALWLSVAWLNHKDEEHAYTEMRQRSSALALAFADHTDITFRSSDHIVLQLRRAWLENPKAFGSAIVAQQTLLGDTSIQIAVIDADGYLVYSNLGFASERVFLGDREHFKVHQVGGRADRLFISRPVKGRVSGKWSIQLTRPIFMADGSFAGVLVLSLDPSYFVRYLQKFALGTQGLTSIVRDTGEIMARNVAHEKFIGTVINTSPVGDAGAGPQGSYRRASQTDGIDRFFSYRHLPQWGLSVRIGLDVDEFLAPVRGQRRAILLAAAAVTLLLSLLAWLLLRSVARMQTAERAQSTDRQRLADIVWGTGVGTWEWNVQTGETRFNERWAGLIGYTLDELAPVSIATWTQHAHPDDLVASGAALEKHFAGLTEGYECESRMRHKLGHWIWVLDRGKLVSRTPDGLPEWMAGTHWDVTERKQSNMMLLEARDQAEAANRAKSRFLATMSHEIRTPMNGILGMAQLLLMPNLEDNVRNDYARTIWSSGKTLLALLNDILDLSKIEAGKLQLESTVFDPEALLHETSNLFAGAAQVKGLQLDYQWLGAADQRYQADAQRLRQMLGNLVGNAVKFTTHGRLHIAATEIRRDDEEAVLEFAVSDTGIGIAAGKLDLLFKPFSQADSSTTREFGGSGLGLSIVRSLALAMGGEVGVTSEPGNGSRFWFQVPVRSLAKAQDSRRSERESPQDTPSVAANQLHGHVLVVEDNLINCMVIESLLRSLGVTVAVVHDGQQGIAAVTAHPDALAKPPQLVLMDLQMPVMDGYAATQHLRQWESIQQCPRLPIIALTADAFEEDRQRCLAAGMDDFLTKPIAIDALKSALAKWLPFAPQTPALAPAAVALKPVDRDAFATVVHELTPLLEENKFAAISRFKALQAVVQGTALAEAIDALAPVLHQMRFDLVLVRLRHIALATQNTGEQP